MRIHLVDLKDHPGPEKRIRTRKFQPVLTLEQKNENDGIQSSLCLFVNNTTVCFASLEIGGKNLHAYDILIWMS